VLSRSGGESTFWGVVLKYLARMGRRNVGGRFDSGSLSKADFRIVLLSIVVLDVFAGSRYKMFNTTVLTSLLPKTDPL